MDAHRKLHTAECGQLLPRGRRHTTEVVGNVEDRYTSDAESFPPRTLSWPSRQNPVRLSQKLPKKAERRTSPPAVPQRASFETQSLSKACPSAWTSRTHELLQEKLTENRSVQPDDVSTLPSMTSSTTLSTVIASAEPVSIPNTQTRKINSGFEVLPAGTHEKESPFKILGLWPGNAIIEKKKHNKLQKRARSGSVSSLSSFGSGHSEERRFEQLRLRRTVF